MHINPSSSFLCASYLFRLKPAFYVDGRKSDGISMEKLAKAMKTNKFGTAIVLTSDGSTLGIITTGDVTR